MSTTYPEPPDGSIVGWGSPVGAVHVRLDRVGAVHVRLDREGHEAAGIHIDAPTDEVWFCADEAAAADEAPMSWAALCARHIAYGAPYLLIPTPLGADQ